MTSLARLTLAARRMAIGATVLTFTASIGLLQAARPTFALGLPLAPSPGSAATLNVPQNAAPEQLRDAALRQLGWTEAAISYVGGVRPDGRERVLLTYLPNRQSTCKADWACLTGWFSGSNRVQITLDPLDGLFARGFAHEFGHAMDNARGYSDNVVGSVLYDLLELSQDNSYPEAAWGARQILQLRDDDGDRVDTLGYHNMLDRNDFSHLSIALLEFGVGNDAAKLPDWFRQAYYPYLQPGTPLLARPVRVPIDRVPTDIAARVQHVVDLIALYCGPSLAEARTHATTTCASSRSWPDAPYAPYPGSSSSGPAAPGIPHSPTVDRVVVLPDSVAPERQPAPVVSHLADQGVSAARTPVVVLPTLAAVTVQDTTVPLVMPLDDAPPQPAPSE